jgi:hypothetical protein
MATIETVIDPACEDCPCPDICLRWSAFCIWAKEGDPVHIKHIQNRSAMTPYQGREVVRCGCGGGSCAPRGVATAGSAG